MSSWEGIHARGNLEIEVFGLRLVVFRDTFNPDSKRTLTSQAVIDVMPESFASKTVLDIGSGSGVLGIKAASLGAEHVVCTDIDDLVLKNIHLNFEINLISSEKYTLVRSNLFSHVSGSFDYIFANLPILDDEWEGVDTANLTENFLFEAKNFLSSDGVLLFSWASFGDVNHVESILERTSFTRKRHEFVRDKVTYFVYELRL
ncbi:MAG: methyltransferase [Candidatus Woesearchaeota archaeon]